jgi:Zn-dependent protease with chaperone function
MDVSPAAVEESIFYVNEKLLNSYPEDARRFVIGHEFSHMFHHDGARLTTLEQQLDMNNPEHQNLFNKMSRFQEARADIFASTQDMKFAEGGLAFLTELYNRHGDQSGISHPKNSERIEAHKTIVALHNQAIAVA